MSKGYRYLLLGLLLALGVNHLVLGMFWLHTYTHVGPVLFAFALYLIALIPSIYGGKELKMAVSQAYFNLLIGVTIASLVLAELPRESYVSSGSYQTWFVAGVSLLLAITSGRGYPIVGWVGIVLLWVQVIAWGGSSVITTSGLIGALILVATAWALGRGLRSTEAEAALYHAKAGEIAARTARNLASRQERQSLLQATLLTGLPLLERIVEQEGRLGDADRKEAILLESRLRDEIQGRALLNDGVRVATREARKRGVQVSFNDDGGMDRLSPEDVAAIHTSIIQAINATNSGKIHIAAPSDEVHSVSITAARPEANAPDLWLRLP